MKEISNYLGPVAVHLQPRALKQKYHPTELPYLSKLDYTPKKQVGLMNDLLVNMTLTETEENNAFYVCDVNEVVRMYHQWHLLLPRVNPYYAVKCNPDPVIVRALAQHVTGFDCASKGEIDLALSVVDSSRIIYANPCKQPSHIRYANSKGVTRMTFDNADELYKIKKEAPLTQCVLRILTDDSKSICRFGIKFGASLATVPVLLNLAKELDLNVVGISFHVGSGCFDETSFVDAVDMARRAFDIGAALGFDFTLLDIGGGFPGDSPTGLSFPMIARVLGPAIDKLFPPNVEVIAEPGRYFVSSAYSLAVNLIAKRVTVDEKGEKSFMYYVNDGMYGSFNCITFDHAKVFPIPIRNGAILQASGEVFQSSIWGPTCDSIDLLGTGFQLPELHIGDWIKFERMGAYTMSAASCFNGFEKSKVFYVNE